jgi:hypothetical protein
MPQEGVLWQVESDRRVLVWPETCDEEVRERSVEAATRWVLKPLTIEKGERYGRFRAAFIYPAGGGEPYLLVPEDDVADVSKSFTRLKTSSTATVTRRVPPKIPAAMPPKTEASCDIEVDVSRSGKPTAMRVSGCDALYADAATDAVKRWRWSPQTEDGVAASSVQRVRLKFSN